MRVKEPKIKEILEEIKEILLFRSFDKGSESYAPMMVTKVNAEKKSKGYFLESQRGEIREFKSLLALENFLRKNEIWAPVRFVPENSAGDVMGHLSAQLEDKA